MSESHTSGPWDVSQIGRRNDGSLAVMGEGPEGRYPVAYVNVATAQPRGKAHLATDDISEANARLIAAAPDLLETLKRLTNEMQVASSRGTPAKAGWFDLRLSMARAAIAKATGGGR